MLTADDHIFRWDISLHMVALTDMNMRANASTNFLGRSYRFYWGKPIYLFGHGLSYSNNIKSFVSVSTTIEIRLKSLQTLQDNHLPSPTNQPNHVADSQTVNVSAVNCTGLVVSVIVGANNSGKQAGGHVVLVFWKPSGSGAVTRMPIMQLVGFERGEVEAGEMKNVTLRIDVCKELSLADSEGTRVLVLGQHSLVVGSLSERQVNHYVNLKLSSGEWNLSPWYMQLH